MSTPGEEHWDLRYDHVVLRLSAGWEVPMWRPALQGWFTRSLDRRWALTLRAGWWDRRAPLERRAWEHRQALVGHLDRAGFVGDPPSPGDSRDAMSVTLAVAGRRLHDNTLTSYAIATTERYAPTGQCALVDLESEAGVTVADALEELHARLEGLVILDVGAPDEVPWGGEGRATEGPHRALPTRRAAARHEGAGPRGRWRPRSADDPRAPDPASSEPAEPAPIDTEPAAGSVDAADETPAPFATFYVPADRFLPADAPVLPAPAPEAPAPARPAAVPALRRPSWHLYASGAAPLIAFFLPYAQTAPRLQLGSNGVVVWVSLTADGPSLLSTLPLLGLVPLHALLAVWVTHRWRAAPLARAPRWFFGGGAVTNAALVFYGYALVVVAPDTSDVELGLGAVVSMTCYALQLLEATTFRPTPPNR